MSNPGRYRSNRNNPDDYRPIGNANRSDGDFDFGPPNSQDVANEASLRNDAIERFFPEIPISGPRIPVSGPRIPVSDPAIFVTETPIGDQAFGSEDLFARESPVADPLAPSPEAEAAGAARLSLETEINRRQQALPPSSRADQVEAMRAKRAANAGWLLPTPEPQLSPAEQLKAELAAAQQILKATEPQVIADRVATADEVKKRSVPRPILKPKVIAGDPQDVAVIIGDDIVVPGTPASNNVVIVPDESVYQSEAGQAAVAANYESRFGPAPTNPNIAPVVPLDSPTVLPGSASQGFVPTEDGRQYYSYIEDGVPKQIPVYRQELPIADDRLPLEYRHPHAFSEPVLNQPVTLKYKSTGYPGKPYVSTMEGMMPTRIDKEVFADLIDERVAKVSDQLGWDEATSNENRVKARTAQQLREGAAIVEYDPTIQALKVGGNWFEQALEGMKRGWENQNIVGKYNKLVGGGSGDSALYARSYLADRISGAIQKAKGEIDTNNSPYLYKDRPLAETIGVEVGRIGADVMGDGTRKYLWNMFPEDMLGTYGKGALREYTNLDPGTRRAVSFGSKAALGILSQNYNPFNLAEGGRTAGFQAVTPTEEDPRKSENAMLDLMLYRGMLGRNGRLLPWEQFREERPDVTYEEYSNYQDYLRDPGFLMGLVKANPDGIDGPEARIMGYRVTPAGVAAGVGILAGTVALNRRGQ